MVRATLVRMVPKKYKGNRNWICRPGHRRNDPRVAEENWPGMWMCFVKQAFYSNGGNGKDLHGSPQGARIAAQDPRQPDGFSGGVQKPWITGPYRQITWNTQDRRNGTL